MCKHHCNLTTSHITHMSHNTHITHITHVTHTSLTCHITHTSHTTHITHTSLTCHITHTSHNTHMSHNTHITHISHITWHVNDFLTHTCTFSGTCSLCYTTPGSLLWVQSSYLNQWSLTLRHKTIVDLVEGRLGCWLLSDCGLLQIVCIAQVMR